MSGDLYYIDQKIPYDADGSQAAQSSNVQNWDYVHPGLPSERGIFSIKMKGIEDAPPQIRQLVRMFQEEPWSLVRKKSFYEQALHMADYRDNVEIVPFSEYFPVYRSMDIAQLRSYFTIRELLRRGKYPDVPLSYLFVYIYEILMQVGIDSPGKGLEILKNMKHAYAASQPKLIRYLDLWMQDYIVFYGLTDRIGEFFEQEKKEDNLAATLADYRNLSESILFDTVTSISSYRIEKGALFKKHPDEVVRVAARTIKAAVPIYEQRYGHTIEELCLGLKKQSPHPIFASAVFYRPDAPKEKTISISPRRRYVCKGGLWSMDTFREKVFSKKSNPLSLILHETDRRLRISLRKRFAMAAKMSDPEVENIIQQEIDQYLREQVEEALPKITVDFSKLTRIRYDADIIRDALLSEEELEKEELSIDKQPAGTKESEQESPTAMKKESLFSDQEREFLELLVKGGDWKTYLRTIHMPIGVMTDNINEKTMEDIQDILIVDENGGPAVLNDYRDYVIDKI